MKMRTLSHQLPLATLTLGLILALPLQAAPSYRVTALTTVGGTSGAAYGINDSGQVVGNYLTAGNTIANAFLYQNGTMINLGTLGGRHSYAYDINNSGQVVGYSTTASGDFFTRAFLYQNGTITDLGTLGGTSSKAYGINDSGQIVGAADTGNQAANHAFLYQSGKMTDLGTLGGKWSASYGINDSGQVVGESSTSSYSSRAFIYQNGTMANLGASYAYDINNSGQVVGYSSINGTSRAFRTLNGVINELGTLGGSISSSYAYGINDSGQVVGGFYTAGNPSHAFLYQNGKMADLNDLIDPTLDWTIMDARDINASGQIAATGYNGSGTYALLLSPVPEPETYALMLAGLGMLGAVARCRKPVA